MRFYVTKAKPVIECIKCGIKAEAGSQYLNSWFYCTDDIHRELDKSMPDIPVGWSSFGWKGNRRDLRCESCTGAQA
jgi:hypothetical protein